MGKHDESTVSSGCLSTLIVAFLLLVLVAISVGILHFR